jgi:hypothetical protein
VLEASRTPPAPLPELPASALAPLVDKATLHAAMLRHVVDFFTRADEPDAPPPRVLLTAETGSRKTGITLKHLHTMIEAHRAADPAAPGEPDGSGARVGPGDRGPGPAARGSTPPCSEAEVMRGSPSKHNAEISSPWPWLDPLAPTYVAPLAGPAPGGGRCTWRDSCAYFAGLDRAKTADLVIVAHNFLIEALPKKLHTGLAWIIVDEGFAGLADRVFDLTPDGGRA